MSRALPLLLILAGCAADARPGEGTVELGTGEWEFVPLDDGQDVDLIFGVQGGYHVWTSFRAEGLAPDGVMLELETQPADGSRAPELSRVPVDMDAHDGLSELVGWPAILSQPGCVAEAPLRIRVTLTDPGGTTATDERVVVPRVSPDFPAPPSCPR